MHFIQEGKGLLTLLRQCQIYQHTTVILSLQLISGEAHLPVSLIKNLLQIIFQRHISFLHLIIHKHKHINQRHLIFRKTIDHLRIILIIYGISRVDQLSHLIIQIDQLGELPRCELIRQMITIQRLDIGKPHRIIHLRAGIQILQKCLFLLEAASRHNQRYHIGSSEIALLHLLRLLHTVLQRRRHRTVAEYVRTVLGDHIGGNDGHQEQRRHKIPGYIGKFTHHRNIRNEVLVLCFFHKDGKQHNNTRHQQENRAQT